MLFSKIISPVSNLHKLSMLHTRAFLSMCDFTKDFRFSHKTSTHVQTFNVPAKPLLVETKLFLQHTLATTAYPCLIEQRRYYRKKKTMKKAPTKPLSFGIGVEVNPQVEALSLSDPKLGFEDVTELQNADDVVKRIFSLEMADGQELKAKRMDNILSEVKEHPNDLRSLEVQIAELTVHIRHQMIHMLEYRKDKKNKIILFNRIARRRSRIEQLRIMDIEKFDWLLKELKIKYTPIAETQVAKIGKRALRRKVAEEKFNAVKEAKLKAFSDKLAVEKVEFAKIKQEELSEIEKQMKEMGIECEMSSLQEVLEALNLGEPYAYKPILKIRRRIRYLQKKFDLHKEKQKVVRDEEKKLLNKYL